MTIDCRAIDVVARRFLIARKNRDAQDTGTPQLLKPRHPVYNSLITLRGRLILIPRAQLTIDRTLRKRFGEFLVHISRMGDEDDHRYVCLQEIASASNSQTELPACRRDRRERIGWVLIAVEIRPRSFLLVDDRSICCDLITFVLGRKYHFREGEFLVPSRLNPLYLHVT